MADFTIIIDKVTDKIRNKLFESAEIKYLRSVLLLEVMIMINAKYRKLATRRLKKGYKVFSEKTRNTITFILSNIATSPGYPGKFYWNVIKYGRNAYSDVRHRPPWREIKKWMDAKGLSGNPVAMADSINRKGFPGVPTMFDEMIKKSNAVVKKEVKSILRAE